MGINAKTPHLPIKFKNQIIGKVFFDFLIENKIVLELKKADRFSRIEIEQVYGYLKAKNLKLGILVHFAKNGVCYKRILNLQPKDSYICINS